MADFKAFRTAAGGRGGGPEDLLLDQRVGAIETTLIQIGVKIDRIDAALLRLEPAIRDIASRHADLNARVASSEGHLKAMPTFVQLAAMLITTWAAGAAIVFALLRASHS
jgi:hypothetical protein